MRTRDVLPDPTRSDRDLARFSHTDLGDLSRDEAWAELQVCSAELARMIFHRERPVVIAYRSGEIVDSVSWLRERCTRLQAVVRSRR